MEKQHDAAHQETQSGKHAQINSPIKGLGKLLAAIAVVGAFVAVSGALGIGDMWVGFLFALYWAGLQRSDFKQLPSCLLGAAIGLSYAFMLRELPPLIGGAGIIISIVVVIGMVYLQIMGWLSVAVNAATMLFMLVSTIPSVIASSQYPKLLVALAFGAGYFAIVIWIAKKASRRFSTNPEMAPPSSSQSALSK